MKLKILILPTAIGGKRRVDVGFGLRACKSEEVAVKIKSGKEKNQ